MGVFRLRVPELANVGIMLESLNLKRRPQLKKNIWSEYIWEGVSPQNVIAIVIFSSGNGRNCFFMFAISYPKVSGVTMVK